MIPSSSLFRQGASYCLLSYVKKSVTKTRTVNFKRRLLQFVEKIRACVAQHCAGDPACVAGSKPELACEGVEAEKLSKALEAYAMGRTRHAIARLMDLRPEEATLADEHGSDAGPIRVDDLLPGIAPKSALGKALAYTANQWEKLSRFLEHSEVPVDNNYCENQIRPFAVGRKAWLFADTQYGARASANLYSLVTTAKANGLEPHAYLLQLFEQLPSARTVEDLEALLPWNVRAQLKQSA